MLRKDMVFKNYLELCDFMGWKSTGGNGKRIKLKELSRFCDYEFIGHKIRITKVFRKEKDKIDERTNGNRGKKSKHITYLLAEMLLNNNNDGVQVYTKSVLYRELNMVNDNYTLLSTSKGTILDYLDIKSYELSETLMIMGEALRRCLAYVLNHMENEGYLEYVNGFSLMLGDDIIPTNDEQDIIIKKVEKEVLLELKCTHKIDVINIGKWSEFKNMVVAKLNIEYFDVFKGVSYYITTIHIEPNIYKLRKLIKDMSNKGYESETSQEELNRLITVSLQEKLETKHAKALSVNDRSNLEKYRASDNYIDKQVIIKDFLQSESSDIIL